jgi:hypothetical protein
MLSKVRFPFPQWERGRVREEICYPQGTDRKWKSYTEVFKES